MKIEINQNERAFLIEDGKPTKYLAPGLHTVWAAFKQLRVEKVSTVNLLADLDERRLALVPADDLQIVTVAAHERGLVFKRGKPALWLGAGVHQVWTVDRTVDRATGVATPLVTWLLGRFQLTKCHKGKTI